MNDFLVENLKYKYSQNNSYAVDDVSFKIEKGSYTAIVGLNGSGKSTLARLLSGLLQPESGTITVNENARIGIVFQSPKDQIVSGIVSRDTEFGPQNLKLSSDEIELRTIESLNAVEMLDRATSSTSELSLGQTQKIALSGIIALRPQILIMDEALAMLDAVSRQDIYEFLRYWHKSGNTIIHITHDVEAVMEADRILGMENGKIYFDGDKKRFVENPDFLKRITGNPLGINRKGKIEEQKRTLADVAFCAKNVCYSYNKYSNVKNISFKLYKGSITALTGPSGAGKSTILELCAGLLKPETGCFISVDKNQPVLAQQNAQGALFENFAADDVAFGPRNHGKKGKELVEIVRKSMDLAAIPFDTFAERHTFEMSGGEQRRLAIAGIIAMDSNVILFDEPTAGLDSRARFEVLSMMRKLAQEGKTILFSTHKKDEADFADYEIKIKHGRILTESNLGVKSIDEGFEDELSVEEKKSVESGEMHFVKQYSGCVMLDKLRKTSTALSGTNRQKKSVMHLLPSWFRILVFLAMFITSICAKSLLFCVEMFLISIIYAKLAGFKFRKLFVSCLKILPFLLIFTVFQMIFHPALENEVQYTSWKWFMITPSKIEFCAAALIRTFASLTSIGAFFISTPEYDLIDGLKILLKPLEIIKIPVRYFILIMEIVFRFIPLLVDETVLIIKTQLIRGSFGKAKGKLARIKAVIPLIVPLIIQTIKRSEILADAITARCFK